MFSNGYIFVENERKVIVKKCKTLITDLHFKRFQHFSLRMLFLKSKHAYLPQTLLFLCSFVYNIPDDGPIQAETCRTDTINDK